MPCSPVQVRGHGLPEVPPPPLLQSRAAAAAFSPCGRYRWWLQRSWDPSRPALVFVGLNPSRADARRDDPTLRRLVAYARSWGFGGLEVLNLFARVAAKAVVLRRLEDPVGSCNDAWICRCLERQPAATVWLGWGNGGAWRGRDRQVLALLSEQGVGPVALAVTAAGHPRHPLYCPAAMTLGPFASSWGDRVDPAPSPCPVRYAASPST